MEGSVFGVELAWASKTGLYAVGDCLRATTLQAFEFPASFHVSTNMMQWSTLTISHNKPFLHQPVPCHLFHHSNEKRNWNTVIREQTLADTSVHWRTLEWTFFPCLPSRRNNLIAARLFTGSDQECLYLPLTGSAFAGWSFYPSHYQCCPHPFHWNLDESQ